MSADAHQIALLGMFERKHMRLIEEMIAQGLDKAYVDSLAPSLQQGAEVCAHLRQLIVDTLPRRDPAAPPWRDDTREQKAFDADVEWHRTQLPVPSAADASFDALVDWRAAG